MRFFCAWMPFSLILQYLFRYHLNQCSSDSLTHICGTRGRWVKNTIGLFSYHFHSSYKRHPFELFLMSHCIHECPVCRNTAILRKFKHTPQISVGTEWLLRGLYLMAFYRSIMYFPQRHWISTKVISDKSIIIDKVAIHFKSQDIMHTGTKQCII